VSLIYIEDSEAQKVVDTWSRSIVSEWQSWDLTQSHLIPHSDLAASELSCLHFLGTPAAGPGAWKHSPSWPGL
jgi:hypothetical protein